MGDDVDAFEQIEDAGAGVVQIDDEDAIAAGVDLQQPDAGAVRVEPGRLGVLDLDGEALPGCGERRDLGRRRLELARGLQLPRHLRLGPHELGEAIQFRFVRRRLDVDRDPVRREHLAEKATRLHFLGAVNDFDAGQDGGRARARGLGLPEGLSLRWGPGPLGGLCGRARRAVGAALAGPEAARSRKAPRPRVSALGAAQGCTAPGAGLPAEKRRRQSNRRPRRGLRAAGRISGRPIARAYSRGVIFRVHTEGPSTNMRRWTFEPPLPVRRQLAIRSSRDSHCGIPLRVR